MIETFLRQLFLERIYTPELIFLYIITGILAGLTRLAIRADYKAQFRSWWNDGTLIGAILISIVGALLFDNNFVWAFLGGYFIIYILAFIQNKLEEVSRKREEKNDTTTSNPN